MGLLYLLNGYSDLLLPPDRLPVAKSLGLVTVLGRVAI